MFWLGDKLKHQARRVVYLSQRVETGENKSTVVKLSHSDGTCSWFTLKTIDEIITMPHFRPATLQSMSAHSSYPKSPLNILCDELFHTYLEFSHLGTQFLGFLLYLDPYIY